MSTAAPPLDPEPVVLPGTGPDAAPIAAAPEAGAALPPARGVPTALTVPADAARCDNCGAPVTQKYCGKCGQRLEPPVHSLWHFSKVAAEDLTHADSRIWRTLTALLFKPGFLTREFLDGRRAGYLPPVRLYLVLSVLFFLWASVAPHQSRVLEITPGDDRAPTVAMPPLGGPKGSQLNARPGETAEQRAERLCNNSSYQGPWRDFMLTRVHQVCLRTVLDNGKSAREAFLHNVPRAMFLFLPLLAGVMMLMYWRPRHYYVEHLLLFLHNHAFVFLLLLLAGLVSALLALLSGMLPPGPGSALTRVSGWVDLAMTLYIAWYAYRSMRAVYGQGRWLTLGKLVVLSFFYLVAGSLMLALTSLYSAFTV